MILRIVSLWSQVSCSLPKVLSYLGFKFNGPNIKINGMCFIFIGLKFQVNGFTGFHFLQIFYYWTLKWISVIGSTLFNPMIIFYAFTVVATLFWTFHKIVTIRGDAHCEWGKYWSNKLSFLNVASKLKIMKWFLALYFGPAW